MNAKQVTISNPHNNKKNYSISSLSTEQAQLFICPRTTEEVYSIGIKLQYMIGDLYLKYTNQGDKALKNLYGALALKQLDKKTEIQRLANIDLNEKLNYFYNNGGPIIEPPVDEKRAREINGFFNRIAENYLLKIEELISSNDGAELESEVNKLIIRMLTDLANLYHEQEIRMAFKELIYL